MICINLKFRHSSHNSRGITKKTEELEYNLDHCTIDLMRSSQGRDSVFYYCLSMFNDLLNNSVI